MSLGIVRRQPSMRKTEWIPLDPSAVLKLDAEWLARFQKVTASAYLQSKNGFKVKNDLPGLRGPAVEKVYAEVKHGSQALFGQANHSNGMM